ncbi:MAG: S41 family peptidase [Chloroflexi bacterium]|nr:MAG: S41 family peptidase [Chloroflexota bacterium]MBL1196009.1 S41 family peptidase [Chloroflexota bacterium]NOH13303.1 S41 family peptidase [Chloroflexota bacterium]
MSYKRLTLQLFLVLVNIVLAFMAGYMVHGYLNPPELEFPVLAEVYDLVQNHAYDPVPEDPTLEYGMIRGLLAEFNDPNTRFVEPPQHEIETDALQGAFGGIGVRFVRDEGNAILLYPFPDSPAREAGIADADRLIQVDDTPIPIEMPENEVTALIRGPEGERVRILVIRGEEQLEFNIRRVSIPLPSVTWHIAPQETRLGVVEINIIAASTPDEVQKAFDDLLSQGATKFVLDLRDNGGGLLEPGVDVARLFLDNGIVMEQQYRGEDITQYEVNGSGTLSAYPMLVLVNHGTASAAEIIAGALQANQRAQLLGAPTFGKDSVQFIFDLQDGSSLHITAARWWVPGTAFPTEQGGLIPDVPLDPNDPGTNPAIEAAIQVLFGDEITSN